MNNSGLVGRMVKFRARVVTDGVETDVGVHVQPYLGRIFKISDVAERRGWKVVVKLEGHDAPGAWIDIGMLDFIDDPYEEPVSFTDEDRDYYDRAFKSLFLNA